MVLICTLVYTQTHKQWSQVKNMAIYLYLATQFGFKEISNLYIYIYIKYTPNFIYKLPVQGTKGQSLISGMQTHSHTSVCLKEILLNSMLAKRFCSLQKKGQKPVEIDNTVLNYSRNSKLQTVQDLKISMTFSHLMQVHLLNQGH